jgi:hypothetical protein
MIHPTPAQLRAVYAMLRSFRPFRYWRLPRAEDVVFKAIPHREAKRLKTYGQYHYRRYGRRRKHEIRIAPHRTLSGIALTMAHEMVHAREVVADVGWQLRRRGRKYEYLHGQQFQRMADEVCKALGFKRSAF